MDKYDYITATTLEEKVRLEKLIKYMEDNNIEDNLLEYKERYNNICKYLVAKDKYLNIEKDIDDIKIKLDELYKKKDEYEVDNLLLEETLISKFNTDTNGKYRNILYEDIKLIDDKEIRDILYILFEKESEYSKLLSKRNKLKNIIDKDKYPNTYDTLLNQDILIEKQDELNIAVSQLSNGATIIDCGVNVDGSFKAGELYTKVCLGGLADVGISIPGDLSEKFALPSVKIKTDSPAISTLGSQKAGWSVSVGDFFALGSGPARAICKKPAETYEEIGYEDTEADLAILTLEADVLPGEDVAQYIADECNVDVKDVYLLVAPTSSLVGSIQISGRVVENGTYKMLEAIKFDVTKVKHAAGIAPIAPIDPDGLKAMGKTNDAVLFGGRTYYYVESDENDDIADVAAKLPSSAADGYGKPFFDVFKEAEFDFYKIDKGMFAPAEVVINDLTTGKIYKEGYVNVDLLKKSFGVDN